jgi:hypothetical protein
LVLTRTVHAESAFVGLVVRVKIPAAAVDLARPRVGLVHDCLEGAVRTVRAVVLERLEEMLLWCKAAVVSQGLNAVLALGPMVEDIR